MEFKSGLKTNESENDFIFSAEGISFEHIVSGKKGDETGWGINFKPGKGTCLAVGSVLAIFFPSAILSIP